MESPQETAGAGLLFLLTVLERLGIGDWLESHPDLIDADLPTRLLRHVAVRLGLPPDDPMLAALPPIGAHGPPAASEWLMPAVWWREVTAGGPPVVRLVRSTDGARALFDNSGRLALALWHGPQPDKLRARVAEHAAPPFQPRGRAERRSEPALLRDSWLAAAARWCRRRAGVGLRGLVRRPGRVSWTRTHIDVVFGIEQIDLRVRRAALDVDPGWVPWLGRVVLFHYVPADADEGV